MEFLAKVRESQNRQQPGNPVIWIFTRGVENWSSSLWNHAEHILKAFYILKEYSNRWVILVFVVHPLPSFPPFKGHGLVLMNYRNISEKIKTFIRWVSVSPCRFTSSGTIFPCTTQGKLVQYCLRKKILPKEITSTVPMGTLVFLVGIICRTDDTQQFLAWEAAKKWIQSISSFCVAYQMVIIFYH